MAKMNMTIAKTHEVSNRLVGMQLTLGNLLAMVLSAAQMIVGFIFLSSTLIAGRWYMYVLVGVVGVLLALLIERLSLGGLIAIRLANEGIETLEEAHFQMLLEEDRDETDRERKILDRRMSKLRRQRNVSIPLAGFGMMLSAALGDIAWHILLATLGAWYITIPLSLACAGVIGLTFVSSELYKKLFDNTLGEIISDATLMKKTVANEQQNIQLDMLIEAFDTLRSDDEKRLGAQEKIEGVLVEQLSDFADDFASYGSRAMLPGPNETTVESNVEVEMLTSRGATKRLDAPHQGPKTYGRGRYEVCKPELKKLLNKQPEISRQDVADHFNISKSTAQSWCEKLEAEES